MLRRSFHTLRFFSSFQFKRSLTSKPIHLVNPVINPLLGQLNLMPKLSSLLSKCPSLLQRNISAMDLYHEGIAALKAGYFDDAYLLWKSAFEKKITIEDQRYLEQIIEQAQLLKINLNQTHFDLFVIHHHLLKDVWMGMYFLTNTNSTLEKNTLILNTLLHYAKDASYLIDIIKWLKIGKILSEKNKELLLQHIDKSEHIIPFLNFSIFRMDADSLSESKEKLFHTLIDNINMLALIPIEQIFPVITQNKLEKLILDAKQVESDKTNRLHSKI